MEGRHTYELDAEDPRHHDDEDEPGTFKEVVVTVLAALVLAYFVQGFLVKPFRIPSGSMENTLHCGDRVLVNRLSYRFGDPERGDVVVFHPPAGRDEQGGADEEEIAGPEDWDTDPPNTDRAATRADVNYIKRIVGEPGDTVEVRRHRAFVNGDAIQEPYLHPLAKDEPLNGRPEFGPKKVPKGTYFMMGDNRNNSEDGRVFGYVPRDFIIGKAFMVYWPPKRVGGLPEKDPNDPRNLKEDPACLETANIPLPEEGS